jgi:ribosomal protein S12 methylthiotransferase accessory factor
LERYGFRVAPEGEFEVVLADDYLQPELEAVNQRHLASGRPWLLIKPAGMVVWVGPLFRPGHTGCWQCLQQRLKANRQTEHYIRRFAGGAVRFQTARARLPGTLQAAFQLAAAELARAMVQDRPAEPAATLRTLDLLSLELREHTLVRRPQCPACGNPTVLNFRPPELHRRPKAHAGSGEHRTARPEETFARYRHHLSPITGAVMTLDPLDADEPGGVHNYRAGHYFPVFSDDLAQVRGNALAASGGKGATEIQARVGALGEALERYSGICWGDEPSVQGSYQELQPEAVHPREFLLFSERQYRTRQEWNAGLTDNQQYVPEPLPEDVPITWTPAWSLTARRRRLLPKAHCYYGHWDGGHFYCRCDSNGCAAGNTLEEAIVQGFLELAERDAVALWWYNRLRRPAVAVDTFGLEGWETTRAYYRATLGRELHVLDVTTDLRVPTFVAVSRRPDRAVEDVIVGFGAHLDPRAALVRALAEASQYLPALRHTNPDGSTRYLPIQAETLTWWKTATYANQPYLVPDPDAPPRRLEDFAPLAADDLWRDVETCVRLAADRGLEVLMVDQTRPDIGLPVVRVVVPGLRHFWRRLGPGRLYDVPVRLGWLKEPLTEDQMNPIACFV